MEFSAITGSQPLNVWQIRLTVFPRCSRHSLSWIITMVLVQPVNMSACFRLWVMAGNTERRPKPAAHACSRIYVRPYPGLKICSKGRLRHGDDV